MSAEQSQPLRPRTRRRTVLVVGLILVVAVLVLVLAPVRVQAQQVSVTPGSSSAASFTFNGPSYVTIHFASFSGYGMRYWMSGPSGMMYDHSMMRGGMMGGLSDSYSFWTWGGQYNCGASYVSSGLGATPVWINATSALL